MAIYEPPYDSPIEEKFAWNVVKYLLSTVQLMPQYTVETLCGLFRLDFVLESQDGRKIGIECDGKEFHDEYRDEWGDSMILGDSDIYAIFRFRGCDIKHHIEDLLYITNLEEPSIFGERGRGNLVKLASDEAKSEKHLVGNGVISVHYHDQVIDNDQIRIELRTKNIPEGKRAFWKSRYNYAKEVGGGELDSIIARYQASQENSLSDVPELSLHENGIQDKTVSAVDIPEGKGSSIQGLTNDRELVVVALQALWRERTTAYNTALTVARLSGRPSPNEDLFAIGEVTEALRRIGSSPPA